MREPTSSTLSGAIKKATEASKNRAAVILGRLGGIRGGPARAEALSAERRSEIAALGAAAAARNRNQQNKKK